MISEDSFDTPGANRGLPDLSDAKFLHCAQAAQAEYIVTGNKRHFPQDVCGAVCGVSTGELLDRITLVIRSAMHHSVFTICGTFS